MKRFLHRLAHKFGWHYGYANSHWEGDDLIMCFKCSTCGEESLCEKVPDYIVYPEKYENHK